MEIRVSLAGATSTAARVIDELLEEFRDRLDADEFDEIEAQYQPGSSAFILREIAKHARETAEGKHTVAEFAQHYCLTEAKGRA